MKLDRSFIHYSCCRKHYNPLLFHITNRATNMSTTCGCDEENDHKTMKNHKTLAFSTLQKEDRRHAKRVTSVLLRQTITTTTELLVKQCLMTFLATMKIMTFSSIIPMHTNLRPEIFVICNNGTWSVCWDHNILLSHKFQLVAYPYNSPLLHFEIAIVLTQLLQARIPLVFRLCW